MNICTVCVCDVLITDRLLKIYKNQIDIDNLSILSYNYYMVQFRRIIMRKLNPVFIFLFLAVMILFQALSRLSQIKVVFWKFSFLHSGPGCFV